MPGLKIFDHENLELYSNMKSNLEAQKGVSL